MIESVRIPGLSPQRAQSCAPTAEFVQIRFSQDDRTRLPQASYHEGVLRRNDSLQRDGTRSGRHIRRVVAVLHNYRDAVHRPREAGSGELGVQLFGGPERTRVECNDRVDCRTLLVIGFDPGQVHLDQRKTVDVTGAHGLVNSLDRRFFEDERFRSLRKVARGERDKRQEQK